LIGAFGESDPNKLRDSVGEFYTEDTSVLNIFKKEWVFDKPSPAYACGYHYSILICRKGAVLESDGVNLNCHEIATDTGYFYFDSQKLRPFIGKLKKLYVEHKHFNNVEEAREYRLNILKDKNLIYSSKPDWTKFNGTFRFEYPYEEDTSTNFSLNEYVKKDNALLQKIKEAINSAYPNQDFELADVGGSLDEVDIEVKCDKTFAEKFKLYKKSAEFRGWQSYDLNLVSYWREMR